MIPVYGVAYGIDGAMAGNFGAAIPVHGAVQGKPGAKIRVHGAVHRIYGTAHRNLSAYILLHGAMDDFFGAVVEKIWGHAPDLWCRNFGFFPGISPLIIDLPPLPPFIVSLFCR
jgi:hypothetical protein